MTCTIAPASRSPATLVAATRPPPTTSTGLPASRRLTGYSGSSTGTAGLLNRSERLGAASARGAVAGGASPLLVEAQDLQLHCEVDLPQRHRTRHADHGRSEVEDRGNAGGHELVGDVLRGAGGRRDDPDGDPF